MLVCFYVLNEGGGILETSMATPLGIRIGCNSFLFQNFPFVKVLVLLGLRLLSPISRTILTCVLKIIRCFVGAKKTN